MATKAQNIKKEKTRAKRALIDSITNRYMINLAWGIFVIILLRFVESGFMTDTVTFSTMKIFAGIFGVLAIGLGVCGAVNLAGKSRGFINYAVFAFVLALGSLWLGFYNKIRLFFGDIKPALLNIDSRWWISWGPIIAVVVYLVVTLVVTAVKISLVERRIKN